MGKKRQKCLLTFFLETLRQGKLRYLRKSGEQQLWREKESEESVLPTGSWKGNFLGIKTGKKSFARN